MATSRSLALVCVLAILSGYAWDTCAGWQPTASMRAACCKAADHACDGSAADDCCAKGEQRETAPLASAVPATLPPVAEVVRLLTPPVVVITHMEPGNVHGTPGRVPTHLLLSVLLV